MSSSVFRPTVAAVVVTRNRIDLLQKTLQALKRSSYPLTQIVVSDDSTSDQTALMLAQYFPDVRRVEGPRRGISANRNRGMREVAADYILLSDDDMVVDEQFVELAIHEMQSQNAALVFAGTSDYGHVIYPNALSFLGFSSKPYKPGQPYTTANQQCFLLSRELASKVCYDEAICAYGYEEMDYAYRVAAAGYQIRCVACANIHLAPNSDQPFRVEQDASRLYVTFKRLAYVDSNLLGSIAFLAVAVPHHIFTSTRRAGYTGLKTALRNLWLAVRMFRSFRRDMKANSGTHDVPRSDRS